jgi:hypothetical protein
VDIPRKEPVGVPLRLRDWLTVSAAAALLLGAALVHGLWSARWDDGQEVQEALARLDRVPMRAGPWSGQPGPLDAEAEAQASRVGIAGNVRALFTRPGEATTVAVVLMAGRFGPLSVHTPDVCYGGAGYAMIGKPKRVEVRCADGAPAALWTACFQKPHELGAPLLRIFWTWNAGEGWKAPDNPRWTFRAKPVLYKLYAAREMMSANESPDADACLDLLRVWMPETDPKLFTSGKGNSTRK